MQLFIYKSVSIFYIQSQAIVQMSSFPSQIHYLFAASLVCNYTGIVRYLV